MSFSQANLGSYTNILRQTDTFYGLTDSQLEMVASICSEVSCESDDVLFEENSASDELYVIVSGEIDIIIGSSPTREPSREDRQPLTIATLRRGQIFGEIALVDQGLRSAAARCASPKARLLVIPRDRLVALCDNYPDLGYRLMRNIAADLAFKIRGTDLKVREQILWQPSSRDLAQ